MKSLFSILIAIILTSMLFLPKVVASENQSKISNSKIIIANKYANKFCNAKADNFFKGLENEKALKLSYFRYIGLQGKEMVSNDMYIEIMNTIREQCSPSIEEENELTQFILKESK